MGKAMCNRDLRAEWSDNPELRQAVKEELRNWAIWSFERVNEHGYPSQQSWYTPPRDQRDKPPPPPPCNVEKAKATEDTLVMWRLVARRSDDPERKRQIATMLLILRLHYLTDKAAHTKAKIAGVGRRTFYRLLEDAEYRYWVMSI